MVLSFAALAPGCISGGGGVTLEWVTASEVDNAGFNVYRSEAVDGPYDKVNQTLIPAGARPVTGGRYTYADRTAIGDRAYWYRLEDVGLDGKKTVHEPLRVVARGGLDLDWFVWVAGGLGVVIAASGWLALGRRKGFFRERGSLG